MNPQDSLRLTPRYRCGQVTEPVVGLDALKRHTHGVVAVFATVLIHPGRSVFS